ncbi:MAG: O-acetyl-ADP-ribose deacetylase [Planctomycetota bacterium]|nr:MAG: O-acetyl-ADP-ribose deacetylase [Planctomycetota bacterium]
MESMKAVQGDITKFEVDAIVNAANHTLLGGGGVDGAIHRAAGPELVEECKTLGGCKTGGAKITKGYNLPAKHVIHTVGPIYSRAGGEAPELLASCYRRSLEVAAENGLKTVAFPAISTGVYGYPIESATGIAVKTAHDFLEKHPDMEVQFVCFSERDLAVYLKELKSYRE